MSISWKFLAEGHGSGILGVGSSYFYYVSKFLCFLLELGMKGFQSWQKNSVSFEDSGDVHNSGEAVIAGLTSVDMVIGMNQFILNFSTKDLGRSVGNNLIGVHVGLGSWTGLPDNQREVII